MTIASEITRIKTNIANAYSSASDKGATLPDVRNSDNLASCIDSISSGGGSLSKYGATIDNFIGNVDENGTYVASSNPANIVLSGATSIGEYALSKAFNYVTPVESVIFPDVENLTNGYSLQECFYNSSYLKFLSFPKLKEITGKGVMSNACYYAQKLETISFPLLERIYTGMYGGYNFSNAFYYCSKLTSVSFPSLTTITDEGVFNQAFYSCKNLVSADFSKLSYISSSTGGFRQAFYGCSKLESVNFDSLQTMSADMQGCFYNCTSLTKISFPSLKNLSSQRFGTSSSNYIFSGCTALTEIHFRADMQSTIESYSGYGAKWGATNATIYFDL